MSQSSNLPLSSFLGSNDLTDKLKASFNDIKEKVNENKKNYNEDLEEFILKNSRELVESGIEAISEIKQTVLMNPQSDEVEALSEIFKGVSSAMNILKDIQIAKMKSDTSKEIKQMDIVSKRMAIEDEIKEENVGMRMTRDEIFKLLKDNGDIVDAEFDKIQS
jgi:Mg2+ and Co2+ transporter CorA